MFLKYNVSDVTEWVLLRKSAVALPGRSVYTLFLA